MPVPTTRQTLVWTALPNGWSSDGQHLKVSLYCSPRLESSSASPRLDEFSDFVNWPQTLSDPPGGPITFSAVIGSHRVGASCTSLLELDRTAWEMVFDPSTTSVAPYDFVDYSASTPTSFDAAAAEAYVRQVYGQLGAASPTVPPILVANSAGAMNLPPGSPAAGPLFEVGLVGSGRLHDPISPVGHYYDRPDSSITGTEPPPTLDFHQTLAALASYPILLRRFGLVFDLLVVPPPSFTSGNSTIFVEAQFGSSTLGQPGASSVNVSPRTACTLVGEDFIARPRSTTDYWNKMLDLADSTRFSVTELDVDGASQRLTALAAELSALKAFQLEVGSPAAGSSVAVTLPSLRSTGPQIIRTGWAKQLQALAAHQTSANKRLTDFLAATPGAVLPTFYAEDLVRGHRFDVFTSSEDSPTWLSLNQRVGEYRFGRDGTYGITGTDEGFVVPGATQPAPLPPGPPQLWVHEAIARWTGWSLSAPRVGAKVDDDGTVSDNPSNPPAPDEADGDGFVTPQMSASFTVPPGTLPKLRFGNEYRYRARAVDLAGNSPDPTVTDDSTATPPVTHYRFEPVVAPVVVPSGPLPPGQGTRTTRCSTGWTGRSRRRRGSGSSRRRPRSCSPRSTACSTASCSASRPTRPRSPTRATPPSR